MGTWLNKLRRLTSVTHLFYVMILHPREHWLPRQSMQLLQIDWKTVPLLPSIEYFVNCIIDINVSENFKEWYLYDIEVIFITRQNLKNK